MTQEELEDKIVVAAIQYQRKRKEVVGFSEFTPFGHLSEEGQLLGRLVEEWHSMTGIA